MLFLGTLQFLRKRPDYFAVGSAHIRLLVLGVNALDHAAATALAFGMTAPTRLAEAARSWDDGMPFRIRRNRFASRSYRLVANTVAIAL